MEITFDDGSTLGEGSFIRVLRSGLHLGKIFHTAGVYRFYEGEEQKLGGPDLQDGDLERLKVAIKFKYRQ